ncbi:MAG: flagellar hook-associated protein FlgK [Planctomycetota bacterium]|nr:flagellar hook-associated protein FlgK [Planctomycetota bacterium]
MAFHSLAIGTSALLTARYGLDITGQNLGNIDTPGYARQRLTQNATLGWNAGLNNAVVGTGVGIKSIKRVANEYVEKQLRMATSTDVHYGNLRNCYSNVQSFFNEPASGNAISDAMNSFWDGLADLSGAVENVPIRVTALNNAEAMTMRFNRIAEQLDTYRTTVNEEVRESVYQISRLLGEIGQLNSAIVATEMGGSTGMMANDLRDQRGEAIKELYTYMDIDVVEEPNGSAIVSVHGRTLVYFDQVSAIEMEQRLSNGLQVAMPIFASDRYPLEPKDGQLAAQIEIRDEILLSYMDELDKLAGTFIWEFNRAYSQMRGLKSFDSITSQNPPLNPEATLDKLVFNDKITPGTFKIVNGEFELIIENRNTTPPVETTINIEIDLDGRLAPGGEPDMILWDPNNPEASNSLINRLQKALDDAAPGVFEVSIGRDYRVSIKSKSNGYGFAFGKDSSGVVAAFGLNVMFTGHNAQNMGINKSLKDTPEYVACAYSFREGDNDGLMDLIALRDAKVVAGKGMTLDEYYQSVAGRLGSEANRTANLKDLQEDILHRMFVQREEVSGVSEDEETAKLIAYQRAFQAAAKYISIVDVLYETLINM